MKIKCSNPKCKYEWNTNSKMLWVTCPSCRLKTERKKPSIVQQPPKTPQGEKEPFCTIDTKSAGEVK